MPATKGHVQGDGQIITAHILCGDLARWVVGFPAWSPDVDHINTPIAPTLRSSAPVGGLMQGNKLLVLAPKVPRVPDQFIRVAFGAASTGALGAGQSWVMVGYV